MATSVVGLFDTYEHAHYVVRQLLAEGFTASQISVVATDPGGTVRRERVDETGNMAGEGAVSGAASGMLVGGLIGLLVGATTLAAPPVGFVIAGPIAGLLAGAGIGAISGGLLGALIGVGIPEEEAHVYAESVRRGSVLVTVQATGAEAIRAQQIIATAGAVDISQRAALYRAHGFTTYDPNAAVFTAEEIAADRARLGIVPTPIPAAGPSVIATPAPNSVIVEEQVVPSPVEAAVLASDAAYLSHFNSTYAGGSRTFESVRPAYQFGHDSARRSEFRGLDWTVIEPQLRLLWERANPNTDWDHYRDAAHFGWMQTVTPAPVNSATLL